VHNVTMNLREVGFAAVGFSHVAGFCKRGGEPSDSIAARTFWNSWVTMNI